MPRKKGDQGPKSPSDMTFEEYDAWQAKNIYEATKTPALRKAHEEEIRRINEKNNRKPGIFDHVDAAAISETFTEAAALKTKGKRPAPNVDRAYHGGTPFKGPKPS